MSCRGLGGGGGHRGRHHGGGWRGMGFRGRGGWGRGWYGYSGYGPGFIEYASYSPCDECWSQPPARHAACLRYHGCLAPEGLGNMSYNGPYSRNFSGLFGLGQTKTATTSTTGKTGTSTQPDRTAQDWGTALQTGGSVVASIIGAATGQQQPAAATTEPPLDPSTYLAPAPATPTWYWPVLIGVGVAVIGGIGYLGVSAKKSVKANRRRSRRHH